MHKTMFTANSVSSLLSSRNLSPARKEEKTKKRNFFKTTETGEKTKFHTTIPKETAQFAHPREKKSLLILKHEFPLLNSIT